MMKYVAALASIMLASVGQFLFKTGSDSISEKAVGIGPAIKAGLASGYIWGGVLCYVLNLFMWMYVLSQMELSKAYPITSLGYIFTLFLGYFFLSEQITPIKIFGISFIIIGVIALAR